MDRQVFTQRERDIAVAMTREVCASMARAVDALTAAGIPVLEATDDVDRMVMSIGEDGLEAMKREGWLTAQ